SCKDSVMKNPAKVLFVLPLLCSLFIFTTAAAQSLPAQANEWKEYSFQGDGIAFSAPSKPGFLKQNQDTPSGPVEIHIYTVDLGDAAVMIAVGDMKVKNNDVPVDAILEGAKAASLRMRNAQLVSEKKVSLQNNSGIEFEAKGEAFHFRSRSYFVKGRLITALTIARINTPFPAEADKLFNSLRLLDNVAYVDGH